MYFPTELGIRISELKPGDEIIILKGEGYPAVEKETVATVWIVAGFSALCADGTTISCISISDFMLTGEHHDEFEVSEAAKQMEAEAAIRRAEQDRVLEELMKDDEPDWSVPDPFSNEPE